MKKIIPNDAILIPKTAELAFKGAVYDVYHWDQPLFDGSSSVFEMLKRSDTAVTIAIVEDKILVIEDEQAHGGKRLTFPGGRVEPSDADIVSGAKRETLEETGHSFKNWRLIKVVQPANEIEWFVYVYLAWELEARGELDLDPGEKIEVTPMDFAQVKDIVMSDQGLLGRNRDIFQNLNSTNDLLNFPEYKGKTYEV